MKKDKPKKKTLKGQLGIKCELEQSHEYKRLRAKFCEKWGITDQLDNAFLKKLLEVYKKCEGIE